MQTSERSTRSSLRVLAERTPPPPNPEPEGPTSQSHGSKKLTGMDPTKSTTGRVMPTRSSKMADVVHVRPTNAKPRHPLNTLVKFRNDQRAEPAFTPRECVTRRSHASGPAPAQRRDSYEKNLFHLKLAKFSDTTVHLIDPFGNAIEILTDVFEAYTLSSSDEEPSTRVPEVAQMAPSKPDEMDIDLPLRKIIPAESSAVLSTTPAEESCAVLSTTPAEASSAVLSTTPAEASSAVLSTTPAEASSAVLSATPAEASSAVLSATPAEESSAVLSATPAEESSAVVGATPEEESCAVLSATPAESSSVLGATPEEESAAVVGATPEESSAVLSATPEESSAVLSTSPEEESAAVVGVTPMEESAAVLSTTHDEKSAAVLSTTPEEGLAAISSSSVLELSASKCSTPEIELAASEGSAHEVILAASMSSSPEGEQSKDKSSSLEVESASGKISSTEVQLSLASRTSVDEDSNVVLSPAPKEPIPSDAASSQPIPAAEEAVDQIGQEDLKIPSGEAVSIPPHIPEDNCVDMESSPEARESGSPSSPHELPNEETADLPNKDPSGGISRSKEPAASSGPSEESVHDEEHTNPSESQDSIEDSSLPETQELPEEETSAGLQEPDLLQEQTFISSSHPMEREDESSSSSTVCISTPDPDEVCKMAACYQTSPNENSKEGSPANGQGEGIEHKRNVPEASDQPVVAQIDESSQNVLREDLGSEDQGKESENSKVLLTDNERAIGDKRDPDLFEKDLFKLEAPSAVMVREQEDDICLDGSNMKYISESEMIRLLEQDKDEPPSRKAINDQTSSSKPSSEEVVEMESGSQQDSDSALPLSPGPGAGKPEPPGPERLSSAEKEPSLPQTKQPDKPLPQNVTPEKRPSDESVTSDKSPAAAPNNVVADSGPGNEKRGGARGCLSPGEEMKDLAPSADLQASHFDKEIESLPSNVLDPKQHTREAQNDEVCVTELNKGPVANQKERKSDLNFTEKSPERKSTANLSLKTSKNLCLDVVGDLTELTPVLQEEDEDEDDDEDDELDNFLTPTRDLSSPFKEDAKSSLEDSELMEEEAELTTPTRKTRGRPQGSGAECLKCGRRIRRSRKEMVWSPVCFKCRLVAKRKERHSTSRKEGSLSPKTSAQKMKPEAESVTDISDDLLSPDLELDSNKLYKCPKCDKAFKLPALLAGHMKCHTLPQCLTCGCPIPLKYKTKRIPRRCQKCIQKIRDGRSASRESSDEGSDNEELSLSLAENPDASSEEMEAADQKGKKDLLETEETCETQEDSADEADVAADGENLRMCPQCDKAFKCNRSLHLHLLSHSTVPCETCGCRLQKKRRAGRWSKKCRMCKLGKGQLSKEGEDAAPGDKVSKRLKAKQAAISQKRKMQSIIKQKKELKWKNMLLAVKKLMNKSKKRKEIAAQNTESDKEESSEKCEASSENDDKAIIPKDPLKPNPQLSDTEEASGPSEIPSSPKIVRKCLDKPKNIKVEDDEVLPSISDVPMSPDFLKEEETWQCLECDQSLETQEALLSHQQSHIEGQPFKCPQCPQVFSTEEYVNSHIPSHDEKRPFQCPECDKTFTKKNHLGVHLRVHSGLRPFACPDCPRRFRQKATLLSHSYSHKNFEQLLLTKPHQCSVCSKSFKQKERLVVHERLHTGECPFSCKDCDKVFPSKARLNLHRKLHKLEKASLKSEQEVKEEEGPFHCQDCEMICSTKASLALHRKVHKLSSAESPEGHPFYCKECDKPFASKATLSIHLKNHSAHKESNPDVKPTFPCKKCDKICLSKASLVQHKKLYHLSPEGEQIPDIKVEGGSPGYPCKDCDKICVTKASLARHSTVHRSPSEKEQASDKEPPTFKCKKCSLTFSTKVVFILHKKTHRPAAQNPKDGSEPQAFRCKRCGMEFTTKAALMLHRKDHRIADGEPKTKVDGEPKSKADGEPQRYTCKDCDKVFATKAKLVLHSKTHKVALPGEENAEANTEGPFVCKDCEKVCSTKASYALHRKVHRPPSSEPSADPKGEKVEASFQCQECDKKFPTKRRLSFHRFKKHGVPPESDKSPADKVTEEPPKKISEDKLFSCTVCGMRFTKLKMLSKHKVVHGDRTAMPCAHCGKSFLYNKSLVNHMKICQGKSKGKKLLLLKKAAASKRKLVKEEGGSVTEEETAEKKGKVEEEKKGKVEEEKKGKVEEEKKGKVEEEKKGKVEEEKKGKVEEEKKAKPKAKKQPEKETKTKKISKEKAKTKTEPKAKEKRPKPEGDSVVEDEGKKSAPEKPSEVKAEKSIKPAPKEQSGKEKAPGKTKRPKKEPPKDKKVKSAKKMRVVAAATAKKKLPAVTIGGKKKLLVKKKRVPLKPKPGAKSGQSTKAS